MHQLLVTGCVSAAWHFEKVLHHVSQVDIWRASIAANRTVDILVPSSAVKEFRRTLNSREIRYTVSLHNVEEMTRAFSVRSRPRAAKTSSVADFNYRIYHPAKEVRF